MQTMETRRWRLKGPEMEGPIARWYARVRGSKSQIEVYRNQAAQLTAGLPDGARVLEVAAGPGYLSIEMARLRRLDVTALDISHTFVEIGSNSARQEGLSVDFQQGDVAKMPFAADSFDLIVCQAAFKNFTLPRTALAEMHRVAKPGGRIVVCEFSRPAFAPFRTVYLEYLMKALPAVATKVSDRGTGQAVGVVTDVGQFLGTLAQALPPAQEKASK